MATTSNFNIDQGTDFSTTLDLVNDDGTVINVAGYSFSSVMRKSYYANTVANLTVVVVDSANGNLTLSLPANVSSNIEQGRYSYSLGMVDTSNVKTILLTGTIAILPSDLQIQPITYTP